MIATSPAGVKIAVQEIVESKAYDRAEHAVIVTSGPEYTRAALELARANDARLWQASDLFELQALAEQRQVPGSGLLRG